MNSNFGYAFVPIFLGAICLEIAWISYHQKPQFYWRESLTSLGVAIGYYLTNKIFMLIPMTFFSMVWEQRLWTISLQSLRSWLYLFLGMEFCYYWYHRFAHQIPWLWVTHAVHHSSRYFNLSAAYRLGWTGWLSGNFLFFSPLCWLGFSPTSVTVMLGLNLFYQFWLHTELIPKLGWLEWLFNTPSHHRVHHASNPEYTNHNYGGVLIIFDRLFGTYKAESCHHRPIYGVIPPLRCTNIFAVGIGEWGQLFRGILRAKT